MSRAAAQRKPNPETMIERRIAARRLVNAMDTDKKHVVDLNELDPATRKKIEKQLPEGTLSRRQTPLAVKLREEDVRRGRAIAELVTEETFTDLVERLLVEVYEKLSPADKRRVDDWKPKRRKKA